MIGTHLAQELEHEIAFSAEPSPWSWPLNRQSEDDTLGSCLRSNLKAAADFPVSSRILKAETISYEKTRHQCSHNRSFRSSPLNETYLLRSKSKVWNKQLRTSAYNAEA